MTLQNKSFEYSILPNVIFIKKILVTVFPTLKLKNTLQIFIPDYNSVIPTWRAVK